MNSHEISLQIAEKEKELSECLKSQSVIDQEILDLDLAILKLREEKKQKEIIQNKAHYNVQQLRLTLKGLKDSFWSCKESGI